MRTSKIKAFLLAVAIAIAATACTTTYDEWDADPKNPKCGAVTHWETDAFGYKTQYKGVACMTDEGK